MLSVSPIYYYTHQLASKAGRSIRQNEGWIWEMLVCNIGSGGGSLGLVLWGFEEGDGRLGGFESEELLEVAPPDEGDEDVGEEVGGLMEVFAGNVAVGDTANQPEGLKGQHGNHAAAEVTPDEVDDSDHEHSHNGMGLEGREGHLLTERLELCLNSVDLLLMALALRLYDMCALQLLQLFVELLDLSCMGRGVHLLMR